MDFGYRAPQAKLGHNKAHGKRSDQKDLKPDHNQALDVSPDQALDTLLDGFRISDLIDQKDLHHLSEWDLETLEQFLTAPHLKYSFKAAREVELRSKSRRRLADTGTLAQYERAVRRLADADDYEDPYRHFSMLTLTEDWTSKQAKYLAKAALNRLASDALLRLTPVFLASITEIKPGNDREFALKSWYEAHYIKDLKTLKRKKIGLESLLELARASSYYAEVPPDIHGIRSRERLSQAAIGAKKRPPTRPKADPGPLLSTPPGREIHEMLEVATIEAAEREAQRAVAARKKGKRTVLGVVRKLEKQRLKTDPDFDWRSSIWHQALSDDRMSDDRRAALAVLIATGCRPVAVCKGVEGHLLKPKPTDNYYKIAVRIPQTKGSDTDFFGDIDPSLKLTEADKQAIRDLQDDMQVTSFNIKGQRWVYFVIECSTPEALWLAEYIKKEGVETPDQSGDDPREQAVLDQISGKTAGSLKISWKHHFQDPQGAAQKPEADRLKIATTKLSEKVARLARKAMPELKKRTRVTAYVFRHAISSDLKEVHDDRATVSAAMGHRSGDMASMYGTRQQSSRGPQNRAVRIKKIVPATLEIRNVKERRPEVVRVFRPVFRRAKL